MSRVLLLAGTTEARALAARLAARADLDCVSSLAGVTQRPERYAGAVRTGGFGGVEGLANWLRAERMAAVIDATHPFAVKISANALAAANSVGAAHARLERPAWTPEPGDVWTQAADPTEAAKALPAGARAFLALGRSDLEPFLARRDLWLAARMIEPPDPGLAAGLAEVILQRPPYRLETDMALLRRLGITHLAAKNAGGSGGRSKLLAARALGLPVVMIARPAPLPAPRFQEIDALLAWLDATLSRR